MALYIQKPVFWNTNHYVAPSGAKANSGYPLETGYGHEEWNNSPRMALISGRQRYRVFHTEGVGKAPLVENSGQTFIFMTASHNKIQQLVGIAGNAMALIPEPFKQQRLEIAEKLLLHDLWEDAWAIPNVREKHKDDQQLFRREWEKNLHWLPNWLCPEGYYWWLDEPVTINPRAIRGTSKLLGMFGSYTNLDLSTAHRLLDAIPPSQRQAEWERLADAIQCAPVEPLDTGNLLDGREQVTSVLATIHARRGQGQFREDLLRVWGGACAVTKLECRELLRASHVKPWSASTSRQRLDSNNGLLLSANLDALFDKGLIAFDDNGRMEISPRLDAKHRRMLSLPKPLRFVPKELVPYLQYHRSNIFRRYGTGEDHESLKVSS